ncbi:MAG: hypothetical protein AAF657_14870 [Acidobacteriota bacterium]
MSYRIEDEPQPGAWTHLVVDPMWPLLAVMFGGAFISWPWFAINGFAVGSPTRRRELALAAGGFVGSFLIMIVILALAGQGVFGEVGVRYALISLTVWKLAMSYWLYVLQSRSFSLYEHFGGTVRNGLVVVFLAYFLRGRVAEAVPTLWAFVLV